MKTISWLVPKKTLFFFVFLFRDPIVICSWRGFTLDRLEKWTLYITEFLSHAVYGWNTQGCCLIWTCLKASRQVKLLLWNTSSFIKKSLSGHKTHDLLIFTDPHVIVWQWQSRLCWKTSLNWKSNWSMDYTISHTVFVFLPPQSPWNKTIVTFF